MTAQTTRRVTAAAEKVIKAYRALEAAKEAAGTEAAQLAAKWTPGQYRVRVLGLTVGVRVHRGQKRHPSVLFVRIPRTSQLVHLDQ